MLSVHDRPPDVRSALSPDWLGGPLSAAGCGQARRLPRPAHAAAIGALALGILALDVLSPLQGAVAVLYTTVVLLAARDAVREVTALAGLLCAFLAVAGYVVSHGAEPIGSPAIRLGVSLVAIATTTVLCVRHQIAAEYRRLADQRYRTIFDAAGIPIWEADWSRGYALLMRSGVADLALVEFTAQNAIIGDANQAAANLFGVSDPSELIGRTLVPFETPEARATLGRILKVLTTGASLVEEETRFRAADGEMRDVLLRVTLPPGDRGSRRVLVLALDVTERNQTHARLAQAQAQLAHASRITTLGQLAASIAHEVNQPLSALMTYARSGKRWLSQEAPGAVEVADCLNHIIGNGTRAVDVIARVRSLASRATPRQDAIDLAELIGETVELLRRDLHMHGIDLAITLGDEVPHLRGDRVQIQQVLINLLMNAEQAMVSTPPGRRTLSIAVVACAEQVTVRVRDSGTGIVGIDPESLFNPFFSIKPDGMGLGLSISRSIVERHGGTLVAANHPDGGAVFSFHLPIRHLQEAHA